MRKKKNSEEGYTKRLAREKKEKAFWHALGLPPDAPVAPHYDHIDFRHSLVTDDELLLLVGRIRSIGMLDLNETAITNEGIRHLTQLENLEELRLKECMEIDDGCIPFLNQLTTLKLLYLKSTPVTLPALMGLTALAQLETLFIGADDPSLFEKEIAQIFKNLPQVELVVNGKSLRNPNRLG